MLICRGESFNVTGVTEYNGKPLVAMEIIGQKEEQAMREDRFSWNDGDVTWDKGFKTRDQLIKEGKIKPDSIDKKTAKKPRRKTCK